MPKRLVFVNRGDFIGTRIFDMRQGLPWRGIFRVEQVLLASGASFMHMQLSPDQSYAVATRGTSSNNTSVINDPASVESVTAPAVQLPTAPYALAVSNTHYAVGGSSPFLYVYRKSDNGVETVSTTGLGDVQGLAFSPDGTKLAVVHRIGTGVRVYNVGTWTYTDALVGGYSTNLSAVCWSADGTRVAVQSSSTPTIGVYSADLATRYFNISDSSLAAYTTGAYSGPRAVRSPLNANHILFAGGGTATKPIIQLDVTTGATAAFTAPSGAVVNNSTLVLDPDPAEDAVYMNHSAHNGRSWTKYQISTRTFYASQPPELRMLCYGDGGTTSAGYILRTTPYQITGTVRDVSNNPAARVVRAYNRATGELAAQTTSDPGTGNYVLQVYDAGPYDVQFMSASGELLNDLFYAKAEPVAV